MVITVRGVMMGDDKEPKKKCCGKFKKKGKHCGSCPLKGAKKTCKPDKEYCKDCEIGDKAKKQKKEKKKQAKDTKKKKKK